MDYEKYIEIKKRITEYTYWSPKRQKHITVKDHKRTYVKRNKDFKEGNLGKGKQLFEPAPEQKALEDLRLKEHDWTRLSTKYPNLLGLTDTEIETYLNQYVSNEDKKYIHGIYSVEETLTSYNTEQVEDSKEYYFQNRGRYLTLYQDLSHDLTALNQIDLNTLPANEQTNLKNCISEIEKLHTILKDIDQNSQDSKKFQKDIRTSLSKIREVSNTVMPYFNQLKKKDAYYTREGLECYLRKIKVYNRADLFRLSNQIYNNWEKECKAKYKGNTQNPFSKQQTIFLTSPRGGLEVLGAFAYANHLDKTNTPQDLTNKISSSGDITYLSSTSLPYGYKITDVNDIVYIDDICMSGEQQEDAYRWFEEQIKSLNISSEQKPRLHYMAIVKDKNQSYFGNYDKWETHTFGESFNFGLKYGNWVQKFTKEEDAKDIEASAVVFPFSMPDGNRHDIARQIYRMAINTRNLPLNVH